ncbi:sensor histidine kinase [Arcanobacterium phocisimile]|uniref:Sensor histidine kinase n=1 Tax=Arcanobacterium phocisimile TaxID=1302235 RepID=A0ABX7IGK1_9ACTO|nr:sensor histidine kinase [Arcanobacterium phocisimile]QRV01990.1 sensor histidine kinase [Arcanobacterium phocisimile]
MNTRRDYVMSLAMALVWLPFLAFPVYYIAIGAYSPTQRAIGYCLVAVFAVVYALTWILVYHPRVADQVRRLYGASFALLLAITFAMLAMFGQAGLSFFPYICSMTGMFVPLLPASLIVLGLSALMEFAGWWLTISNDAHALLLISIGVFAMTSGSRHFDHAAREKQAAATHEAIAEERNRLSRDMHDVLGHSLTIMSMKSELALRLLDKDPAAARSEIEAIRDLSRSAIAEVRATVSGLRMQVLGDELTNCVRTLRESGLAVTVHGSVDDVDPRFRFVFSWVVREASTNILRHARARHVTITLRSAQISVSDDGVGLPEKRSGHGLIGLAERIAAAGGVLELPNNQPGTIIQATME